MWRKLAQSTFRRKSLQDSSNDPYLASDTQRHVFFLGALAHVWSEIEDLLDVWVEMVHSAGGASLIQADLPPSLDRELDYLSEAIREGLIAESVADNAKELIQQIHRIKGFRHTLIHGRMIEAKDGKVIVDHSRARGSARIRARVTFSRPQMVRHYERAYSLMKDLDLFLFGARKDGA